MKGWIVLLILAVIGLLVFQGYQSRQEAVWKAERRVLLAQVAQDEATANRAVLEAYRALVLADSQYAIAVRLSANGDRSLRSATLLRDSLRSLGVAPDTCLPWVALLHAENDTLRSALASERLAYSALHASQDDLRRANTLLATSDSLGWASVDSLTALVGRVPSRSRFQPLLIVGAGATLSGGVVRVGPTVAVGFRVSF